MTNSFSTCFNWRTPRCLLFRKAVSRQIWHTRLFFFFFFPRTSWWCWQNSLAACALGWTVGSVSPETLHPPLCLHETGNVELLLRLVGENKHFFCYASGGIKFSIFTVCRLFLVGFAWDKRMNKVEEGRVRCLRRQADRREHIIERSIVSHVSGFFADYSRQHVPQFLLTSFARLQ